MTPPLASIDGIMTVVAFAFFGPLLPHGYWMAWKLWRHGEYPPHSSRSRYSREQMLQFRRAGPIACVAITAGLIAVGVDELFGHRTPIASAVILVFGLLMFAAGGLTVSVRYLNRPQWAIAPVLRERDPNVAAFRSEYVAAQRELGKVLRQFVRSMRDIAQAERRAPSPAQMADRYEACIRPLRRVEEMLEPLTPPAELAPLLARLVSAIDEIAHELHELAAARRASDPVALTAHHERVRLATRSLFSAHDALEEELYGRFRPDRDTAAAAPKLSRV